MALSMKLLIDTKSQRVVLAEASKDAVDFLCSLLALPVATIFKLVGANSGDSSAANLHASVGKISHARALATRGRALPRPTPFSPPPAASTRSPLLRWVASLFSAAPPPPPPWRPSSGLFKCSNAFTAYRRCGAAYVTDVCGTLCPGCCYPMTTELNYVSPAAAPAPAPAAGVSSSQNVDRILTAIDCTPPAATYTVTDDLTVAPMSSISSITVIASYAVTDLSTLEEKTVRLGYTQGLEILRASLQSKTFLTDVFLGKNN
ncbi:hypothetical protein ACP4OV_022290 [Aristida adscensionis]